MTEMDRRRFDKLILSLPDATEMQLLKISNDLALDASLSSDQLSLAFEEIVRSGNYKIAGTIFATGKIAARAGRLEEASEFALVCISNQIYYGALIIAEEIGKGDKKMSRAILQKLSDNDYIPAKVPLLDVKMIRFGVVRKPVLFAYGVVVAIRGIVILARNANDVRVQSTIS